MEKVKLAEFCDLQNGYAFSGKDYIDHSNTFNCRMSNIRPDASFDIEYNAKYLPDEYAEKLKKYRLYDGDLIIAMTDLAGDPKILGVPAIVETNGKNILLNQRVGKLINLKPELITNKFLKYALSYKGNKNYYKKFAGGGLQLNIGKKEILGLEINYYSSLDEQNEITCELDNICEAIDNRKKILHDCNLLIDSLFEKEISKLSLNETLGNTCKFLQGTQFPVEEQLESEEPGYKRFLRIVNYTQKSEEFRYVKPKGKEYYCSSDDVVVVRYGATAGFIGRGYEGILANNLFVVIPNERINKDYLYYCLKTNISQQQIASGIRQSSMPALNHKDMKEVKIVVPDKQVQEAIVSKCKLIEKQIRLIEEDIVDLEKIFDIKMEKYFS